RTLAASAQGRGEFYLLDANTGQVLRTFEEPSRRPPWMLAFSADGKMLATGSLGGTVRLWDLEGGRELVELKVDPAADPLRPGTDFMITGVAISPDGRYLAAAAKGAVRVWDVGPLVGVSDKVLPP